MARFGHIFAKGPNREAARKSLRFALMNLDISGDIRHPVDYLVDLIETKADALQRWRNFRIQPAPGSTCMEGNSSGRSNPKSREEYRENTIDTMWLDGLIASKAILPSLGTMEVVFYAAAPRERMKCESLRQSRFPGSAQKKRER